MALQEFLNGGFQFRLLIPVEDHERLSQSVGQGINLKIDDMFIVGSLEKVATKKIKDKMTKETNVYNEVCIQIERIMVDVEDSDEKKLLLTMPDKKCYIRHTIDLNY